MSRSYRVSVKESVRRTIRAEDRVSTCLEILEVLPPEQMAGLLRDELERRGFEKKGEVLVRREDDGVTITVDPETGSVTVAAAEAAQVSVEAEKHGRAFDDVGPNATRVKQQLRGELKQELDQQVDQKQEALQSKVTDKLEGRLSDLRQELDQVVNRVTAEALKRKAAQLGQIKEMTEDPQAGSLTIVVEV
jgi:hypothetical protein